MADRTPIDDEQLRAIVNSEIRSAMGEITDDLSNERAQALDYYFGESVGKLFQPNADRSKVVITTVRDTVEWLMPQLMRMFAQPDKVVEFDAVGDDDEDAAKQETQAINHIFWRQNEGFLLLYSWFKDALLQKNGYAKYWIDEAEEIDREEYDGLTDIKLAQMMQDDELEVIEREASETRGIDGSALHHVVFERKATRKTIRVMIVPPEDMLVSDDCHSVDLQADRPRMVGHRAEKTRTQLIEMGFNEDAIDKMMAGATEYERYDQEHLARYNLSDEQEILTGGTNYSHESQRTTELYEIYMDLDRNGDGYAEMLRIYYAGDYVEAEEADHVPFASLTPYINPHKHNGLSEHDMVKDLQEVATFVIRNVLDNMYQTNNARPIVNERVDLDSLLTTRPGAPIYVEDNNPVGDAVMPFAPPAMWKDGLELLEYLDQIRKDRTGIGDETMGLDPKALAQINTGVMLEAIEATRGKIELVARIFSETGIKWLFRGIHELARKNYDQELRYELGGKYVEVNPQEWRKRTSLTVNVGTASGSQQRELAALTQIGEVQAQMVQAGGLGVTVLPMHIYQTAKELAENLGRKNGDAYFLNPMMLQDPRVQQLIQTQMPQPDQGPDPQTQLLELTAQVEQGKTQVTAQKNQMDFAMKQAELALKREEMGLKGQIAQIESRMEMTQESARNATEIEKARADAQIKNMGNELQKLEISLDARQKAYEQVIAQYRAELDSATKLELKQMDLAENEAQRVTEAGQQAQETRNQAEGIQRIMTAVMERIDTMASDMAKPREIKRDANGRPISVGDRPISYNSDGTIEKIG